MTALRLFTNVLLLVSTGITAGEASLGAGGRLTTADSSRDAYQLIAWDQVPELLRTPVALGRSLVRQTWVIPPSSDRLIAGLGPTYNRPSCLSCHPHNGRGQPPASSQEPMRSMLIRLSIPGEDEYGGPLAEPRYGDQLNEFGVPGVPGEGEAWLEWHTHVERLADGTEVELRRPTLHFRRLAFGELHPEVMTSALVAPPLFGLGLLEAVPEDELLAIAAKQRSEGRQIAGVLNRVHDRAINERVPGRFGWKANQPSLRQQIAAALSGDMNITTDLFPAHDCPPVQTACRAVGGDHPELSTDSLNAMTLYHQFLAVPARRDTDNPQVRAGEALFHQAGCASCHRPTLQTGEFPDNPALAHQTIHPYTDLLLHDMGEGLADHRPDYRASGRHWRTPPLWGVGLLQKINEHHTLMHDGRARTFLEAILWHGGEAAGAREAVRNMSNKEREHLRRFLESL